MIIMKQKGEVYIKRVDTKKPEESSERMLDKTYNSHFIYDMTLWKIRGKLYQISRRDEDDNYLIDSG